MSRPIITCKCGSQIFEESARCSGWWKTIIDGCGEAIDTDLSGVKYQPLPKTVICVECGRRNPNPRTQ